MKRNISKVLVFLCAGFSLTVCNLAADDVGVRLNSSDGSTEFAVRDSADSKIAAGRLAIKEPKRRIR